MIRWTLFTIAIGVFLFVLMTGCSTSPWIDADSCKVRANMVIAGMQTEWPGTETRLVYGKLGKIPHVEAQAFIEGKWQYARLIAFSLSRDVAMSHWQIVLYDNIARFSPNQGRKNQD